MKPDYKRRIVKKVWRSANTRLRKLFNISNDEMILNFEYDESNQELILTTLKDWDIEKGDI